MVGGGGKGGAVRSGAAPRLLAPRGKFVLKAQKIEEIQLAAFVAVGGGVCGGELVLEAEEIEEVQFVRGVAIGVAGAADDELHARVFQDQARHRVAELHS